MNRMLRSGTRNRREVSVPLLWFARVRYLPGEAPTEPRLREAWELGRSHRLAEACPTPQHLQRLERLSAAERDAYWGGMSGPVGKPAAPIPWPIEAMLLAVEAGMATVPRRPADALWSMPIAYSVHKLRADLERLRAEQLGVSASAAPRPRVVWDWLALELAWTLLLRLRGLKRAQPPWSVAYARALIREIDRRQAWQRTLAGVR